MAKGILILFCLLLSGFGSQPTPEQKAWGSFKQQFVSSEGRIIAHAKGISHSEGQGYGLLFAVYFNDPDAFAKIWKWSRTQLQVRDDYLFSWKYVPGAGVTDSNNASDGDILIAWALLKAAKQWHKPIYLQQAQKIFGDISNKLTATWQGHRVILPAEHGFISKSAAITINLSYWVFPAFLDFLEVDNDPVWKELIDSGIYFINTAYYGAWQLPADWLQLNAEIALSADKPSLFGYEAIRIPLYLSWAKLLSPGIAKRFTDFAAQSQKKVGYLSPVVNLLDNSLVEYPAPPGFIAVYQQIARTRVSLPTAQGDDYYSRSLSLLAFIAQK